MLFRSNLGGYSYGRSDLVRRAMSKKKMSVMLEEKEYFIYGKKSADGRTEIPGCIAKGIPEKAAEAIFEDMVSFAQYAFNKSHAAAYAVISYETAYLKCHYPVEYMAALMTSMMGQARHIAAYTRNCQEMGIRVLPPSVLYSGKDFTVENGQIRYGLAGVKNVGNGIVQAIIDARQRNGLPSDIYEFVEGIDPKELNKKAIESLIKAGALDDIHPNRAALYAVHEEAVSRAQQSAKRNSRNQISFFQLDDSLMEEVHLTPELPKVRNFETDQLLAMEKEMLGVYISGHPLDDYRELIDRYTTCSTTELMADAGNDFAGIPAGELDGTRSAYAKFHDGDRVIMAGMLTAVKTMITKKSQEMARVQLEDYGGIMNAIIFPGVFEKFRFLIANDAIVAVSGRLSFKEDSEPELLIDNVADIRQIADFARESSWRDRRNGGYQEPRREAPRPERESTAPPALVKLRVTDEVMEYAGGKRECLEQIMDILYHYPGRRDVLVFLPDGSKVRASKEYRVRWDDALRLELEDLLGEENVKGGA